MKSDHDRKNDIFAEQLMAALGDNRTFPVLEAIGKIKEIKLVELLHITQALHEKVKSSMDLSATEREELDGALDADVHLCQHYLTKRREREDQERAEHDDIMENGSRRQREDAFYGDRSNANERVAA